MIVCDPPLILASQSASRRAMLTDAGIAFDAVPADIDEREIESTLTKAPPAQIALELAEAKARAVSRRHPDRLILGSDSLVEVDRRRFDKPRSREEAEEHLRFFSGRTIHLHSAAALVRGEQTLWRQGSLASLQVADLDDRFIAGYLDLEWPAVSACVGVFRIEGRGVQLFEAIEGDMFTVLGMPLLEVLSALRKFGGPSA